MQIRFKKLDAKAKAPNKAHADDAGFDLVATSLEYDTNGNIVYGTGLAIEIPKGHVGLLFPRSSNAKKTLLLSNSVGVIDSGYRGEIMFKFKPSFRLDDPDSILNEGIESFWQEYEVGDRIGQLIIMPYPEIEFSEVSELSDTDRGNGGYGSTGK